MLRVEGETVRNGRLRLGLEARGKRGGIEGWGIEVEGDYERDLED